MKKIIIPSALVLAAVVTAIVVFAINSNDKYRLIKVKSFDGEVVVDRDGEDTDAFNGLQLIPDDTVEVSEKSFLELLCDRDKHICAEENTSFVIDSYGDEKDGYITIKLLYGKSLFTIDNKLPEDSSFKVKTPNATLSVRGTKFSVEYNKETGETTVEVFEGKVWASGNDEETILEKGDKAVFGNNGSESASPITTTSPDKPIGETPEQPPQQNPDESVNDLVQYMYFQLDYNYDFDSVDTVSDNYSDLEVISHLEVFAEDFSGFYSEGYYSSAEPVIDSDGTLNQATYSIVTDYILSHKDEIDKYVADYDELTIQRLEQDVLSDTYTRNVADWFPETMSIIMPISDETAKVSQYELSSVIMSVKLSETENLSEAEKSISGYYKDASGVYWYVSGVNFAFCGNEYL